MCSAAQRHFGLPSPALVEKDGHVVKALGAITAADTAPARLVFGGGTALGRGHRLIRRMSEDIDLRIISDTGAAQRAGGPRAQSVRSVRLGLVPVPRPEFASAPARLVLTVLDSGPIPSIFDAPPYRAHCGPRLGTGRRPWRPYIGSHPRGGIWPPGFVAHCPRNRIGRPSPALRRWKQ